MVEFWPERQTFHNNLMSSSSPLLIFVIPHPFAPRESSHYKQTCFIVFAVGTSKHAPFKLRITTPVGFNILPRICLVHRRRENRGDLRGEAVLKIWILQPCTLKAHCVCLESLSVMSRMRNVAVWFFTHAAGSSISGNISHSASLTPSALLQYPHIFPSFHFFPSLPPSLAFSLLSDHSYPSSLLHHPAQSQPLPPFSLLPAHSLTPSSFSSTHYFLRFSNMPFHRMLPPVSLGRKGGLLVFLFGKLVKHHHPPSELQLQVTAVKTHTVTIDERQQSSRGATKGAWRPTKPADTVTLSGSCS
ncbi:uncharacterized protein LOC121607185 [Chelmon rostratus]|uniref:uncharacterized protein LOC121607185 n=1 Tax=Chelmon rostratus TaxID=109905 RepID=UPI001BE9B16C|nr:uncharacterized protein LOC121607185 [Chelmon rostratus]